MENVTRNHKNFAYVCSVVHEAMDQLVEETKDMNIIAKVDDDIAMMGLTGDLIDTLVAKRFNEKIKAKA